jgi:hypothetical protein
LIEESRVVVETANFKLEAHTIKSHDGTLGLLLTMETDGLELGLSTTTELAQLENFLKQTVTLIEAIRSTDGNNI